MSWGGETGRGGWGDTGLKGKDGKNPCGYQSTDHGDGSGSICDWFQHVDDCDVAFLGGDHERSGSGEGLCIRVGPVT